MNTPSHSRHLIERAAERLRAEGNQIANLIGRPAPAPESALPAAEQAPLVLEPAWEAPAPAAAEAPLVLEPAWAAPPAAEPATEAPILVLDAPLPDAAGPDAPASATPPPEVPASEVAAPAVPEAKLPAIPRFIPLAAMETAGLVMKRPTRSRTLEEFRIAESRILRLMRTERSAPGAISNVLLITSTMPAEGKSFTAINIAGSMAQHEREEILLVDIDSKDYSLTQQMGLGKCPGVIDLMRDNPPLMRDVVLPTDLPNLSMLPIGRRSRDSTRIPRRAITTVIDEIARHFRNHIIVLDSPPALATSDASTLAPVVGQILMVVEAERTQRSELAVALDLIKECPNITLLLNKIRLTRNDMFGAYDYFGMYS